MKVECAYDKLVPLGKIIPNPRNPNTHPEKQIKLLAKIIDAQGWRAPITVSNRSGFIVRGHARLKDAQLLGLDNAPVDYQDYETEAQEWADLIADNRIAELAEIDLPLMKDLLSGLDDGAFDMDLTGFDNSALEELMTQFHQEDGLTGDDEVPEPQESICKPGDLWVLGNHRLLCGDATVEADVKKLMGKEKADMVFTDPPYGIDVVGKDGNIGGGTKQIPVSKFKHIQGDDIAPDVNFLIPLAAKVIIWGGNYLSHILPRGGAWLVWDKDKNPGLTFSDCELAWTNLPGVKVKKYTHRWDGYSRQGESGSRLHPAQKSVLLLTDILGDYSKKDGIILDPYLGSGSTLIACEKLGRRCFGMEIDSHYCDVIITRWQNFTGKTAELQTPS